MTHTQRIDKLITALKRQGVPPSLVAPLYFRFLWALGLHTRPPLFLGFVRLSLLMSLYGAAYFGALAWFWDRQTKYPQGARLIGWCAAIGLLVGPVYAAYYRWQASRLRLLPWGSYFQAESDDAADWPRD